MPKPAVNTIVVFQITPIGGNLSPSPGDQSLPVKVMEGVLGIEWRGHRHWLEWGSDFQAGLEKHPAIGAGNVRVAKPFNLDLVGGMHEMQIELIGAMAGTPIESIKLIVDYLRCSHGAVPQGSASILLQGAPAQP